MNFIPEFITMPFAMLLRFLSILFDSYGFALIGFAFIVTLIRVPFDIKGKRGTMGSMVLQPKIKAIQEKYAGNQQKIAQEQQKLYKEAGVKPMSGCLWTMFPMLIVIVLISIVRQPLTHMMGLDYYQIDLLRQVANGLPGVYIEAGIHAEVEIAGYIRDNFAAFYREVPQIFDINMRFLGMDIGRTPQWNFFMQEEGRTWAEFGLFMLPVLSTASIYLTQKIMTATNMMQQQAQQMQMMKTLMLVMPLMSLWIGFTFPAAMSLYWMLSGLMFAICNIFINRHFSGIFKAMQADMEAKDAEREAELEEKRKKTEALRALNATRENKGTSKKKKQLAEREKERQRQAEQRALSREEEDEDNPSRVGHRKNARGRAYDPDRFDRDPVEEEAFETIDEELEYLEAEAELLAQEALEEDGIPAEDDWPDDEPDDFDDFEEDDYEDEEE